MNENIFRENDIRGIVGTDLTEKTVAILANSVGIFFARAGVKNVSLGYDIRESSPIFRDLFVKGLNQNGLNVINYGTIPTPLLYFTLFTESVEAGVMITGSHNPPEFNGFKLCLNKTTLHGRQIQQIKNIAMTQTFANGSGTLINKNISSDYSKFVRRNISVGSRKIKLVVDAGNGIGGTIAVPLYQDLGFEIIGLFIEPHHHFPNHHPNPTLLENMQDAIKAVRQNKADLAIVFDGDADRIGVIDETGKVVSPDQLMMIFARSILEKKKGGNFIGEVKCSQTMYDFIEENGGKTIMSKVGHSLIKEKMLETGAVLAGEMSGHFFFADRFFGFDDAIYTGARLLEILSNHDRSFSKILRDLPKAVNTPEIRISCADDKKFAIVKNLTDEFRKTNQVIETDGARILFKNGWGLVRASNTEANLTLRFEANDEESLQAIQTKIGSKLRLMLKNL